MFTSGHSLHLLRCPTANWCTEAKAVCSRWIPGSLLNAAILGLNLDSRDIVGAWICQLCCIHSKLQGCSNNNRKCKIKMPALTAKPLFLYRPHSCQCWCWCVLHRRGNEHLHSVCLLNCPSLFLSFLFSLALRGNLILMATPPALRWVKDRPRCWSPPPAQAPRAAGHCLPGAPWHRRKATGHPKSLMVSGISHTWELKSGLKGEIVKEKLLPVMWPGCILKWCLHFGGFTPFGCPVLHIPFFFTHWLNHNISFGWVASKHIQFAARHYQTQCFWDTWGSSTSHPACGVVSTVRLLRPWGVFSSLRHICDIN